VYNLAPIVFLVPCMLIFATMPWAPGLGIADLNIGILFFLAVSAMEIVGPVHGGWGSNNKYALLSAMRAVNQIISYDLPFIFVALVPVVLAGSLSSPTSRAQPGLWFVFYPVSASSLLCYLVATLAAENRVPFDILEAESELSPASASSTRDEVRPDPARRVRAHDRHLVPRRPALPRRVGRPGPAWLGPFWFLLKAMLVFLSSRGYAGASCGSAWIRSSRSRGSCCCPRPRSC
jgi:formate hydrogenlyase subunit 4